MLTRLTCMHRHTPGRSAYLYNIVWSITCR